MIAAAAGRASRIDIASIRREQIVEAAVAVINERGLQRLSLSEIESKVGMSRGQLTYYFKTKEAILLAVFDRLVALIQQRQGGKCPGMAARWEPKTWREVVEFVLGRILEQPPAHPEFGCLQYTFLSQISHREDFRQRLASLYQDWRGRMARILARQYDRDAGEKFPARSLASLIQAMFHGVAMQVAADPRAIDRREIVDLCLDMVGTYLEKVGPRRPKTRPRKSSRVLRTNNHAAKNGVKHE